MERGKGVGWGDGGGGGGGRRSFENLSFHTPFFYGLAI